MLVVCWFSISPSRCRFISASLSTTSAVVASLAAVETCCPLVTSFSSRLNCCGREERESGAVTLVTSLQHWTVAPTWDRVGSETCLFHRLPLVVGSIPIRPPGMSPDPWPAVRKTSTLSFLLRLTAVYLETVPFSEYASIVSIKNELLPSLLLRHHCWRHEQFYPGSGRPL
jgi:hypothetical protein